MHKSIPTLIILLFAFPVFAKIDGFTYKTYGSNGGAMRLPHTIQPEDIGNRYLEMWNLSGVTFYEINNWKINLYIKQSYSEDTFQYVWNNKAIMEGGIQIQKQLDDYMNAYLNYSYNIQDQRIGLRFEYKKLELGYNYYRDWWIGKPAKIPNIQVNKNALKFWGNVQTPSSAYPKDTNITVTNFGQLSRHYGLFGTKYELAPFASLKLTVDSEKFDYNNALQPNFGIMFVSPTKLGEIFIKFGYAAEYRWISKSSQGGPIVEIGWYKAEKD